MSGAFFLSCEAVSTAYGTRVPPDAVSIGLLEEDCAVPWAPAGPHPRARLAAGRPVARGVEVEGRRA